MRLIVRGPQKYDDFAFVKKILDKYTANAKDVVLISDLRIDEETNFRPSHFPLAEDWIQSKWLSFWRRIGSDFEGDRRKFSVTEYHYAPYRGDKQWSKGLKAKRLKMFRDATHMVAFHDVGGNDYETEAFIELARMLDFKHKVVLI